VEASSVGPRQVHHSPLRILISWCWQRQSDFVDLLSHLWSKWQTKWLNDNNIWNTVFNIMIYYVCIYVCIYIIYSIWKSWM
jgi:hypothetical protein